MGQRHREYLDETENEFDGCKKIEPTFDDRLAELEAYILKYYLAKGYKLEKDQTKGDDKWAFKINIESLYKNKKLNVILRVEGTKISEDDFLGKTTKEMFDKAFEYFTIPYHGRCPYGLDEPEEHF